MAEKKKVDLDHKRTIITFEGREYQWHKRIWTSNNLFVGSAMTQRLTAYAISSGLLTKEDFASPKFDDLRLLKKKKIKL